VDIEGRDSVVGSSKVIVNLADNDLECACDSAEFIRWVQKSEFAVFTSREQYSCVHANGSTVKLMSVNVDELLSDCEILNDRKLIEDSPCPCDSELITRIERVKLALSDRKCAYKGSFEIIGKISNNITKPWCIADPFDPEHPRFVVPISLAAALLVVISITFVILYRKRETPTVQKLIECVDFRPFFRTMVNVMLTYNGEPSREMYQHDIFLYYHDYDADWTRRNVLDSIKSVTGAIQTIDDIDFGSHMREEIAARIKYCRVIVIILTPDFLSNDELGRDTIVQIYNMKRAASLFVVVRERFEISEGDLMLNHMMDTVQVIHADCFPNEQLFRVNLKTWVATFLDTVKLDLSNPPHNPRNINDDKNIFVSPHIVMMHSAS